MTAKSLLKSRISWTPALGNLVRFRKDPTTFLLELAELGDIVPFSLGGPAFLLHHPDHVKDVLVTNARKFKKGRGLEAAKQFLGEGLLTSEGEEHRRERRLVQPAFHRDRIHGYGTVMAEYAAMRRDAWQDGQAIDFPDEMMRFTLKVVAKTLFDADVDRDAHDVGQALSSLLNLVNRMTNPLAEFLDLLPLPANRRRQAAGKTLDTLIYRIISERRASGEDRGDLLSMLLIAQDDEGDGKGMTDQQVRDEALTLFLAGHETTAIALTWTFVLLTQHPEVEAKLQAEIDDVLVGRALTVDDVPKLPYARMVMSEAIRLYPPAWVIGRRALEPHEIAGVAIPKGAMVLMSPFVSHRDPRFFQDPLRFDPERFGPEHAKERPPFAFFPFGGGQRVCIGESFAWMEGVLAIAAIVQRWHLRLPPGQDLGLKPMMTLRPKGPIMMIPESRR